MIDKEQLENVEYLNYLGSNITTYTKCTLEIKSRIAMDKAAFNRQQNIFASQFDLKVRRKLMERSTVWS
jgi:hypothetical protein